MTNPFPYVRTGLVLAFLVAALGPASAANSKYEETALMHAMVAKVLGTACPGFLSASDMSELESYIERWVEAATQAGNGAFAQDIVPALEETYTEKYPASASCHDETRSKARALLRQIREVNSDPAYWAYMRTPVAD